MSNKLKLDSREAAELQEVWIDFLEQIYMDLPKNATAISVGQVLAFLLAEYQPPMDEFVPVLENVLTKYVQVYQPQARFN